MEVPEEKLFKNQQDESVNWIEGEEGAIKFLAWETVEVISLAKERILQRGSCFGETRWRGEQCCLSRGPHSYLTFLRNQEMNMSAWLYSLFDSVCASKEMMFATPEARQGFINPDSIPLPVYPILYHITDILIIHLPTYLIMWGGANQQHRNLSELIKATAEIPAYILWLVSSSQTM